jgi:hypothetical protein
MLGTAAQDKPPYEGQPVTLRLQANPIQRPVALTQTLLVYGLSADDTQAALLELELDGHTNITLPDVPDLPILVMGLQDCGIIAHPLPF